MRADFPRPISSIIFGSCVVLPEPVSPQTMTTGCSRTARWISSRRGLIGSDSSKVMLPAVSEEALQVARDEIDLEVHLGTGGQAAEGGDFLRVRDEEHLEEVALDAIHC